MLELAEAHRAYVFMFIEAMADAAVMDGMPRTQAYEFAAQAVLGSAKMVLETGMHPGVLKAYGMFSSGNNDRSRQSAGKIRIPQCCYRSAEGLCGEGKRRLKLRNLTKCEESVIVFHVRFNIFVTNETEM